MTSDLIARPTEYRGILFRSKSEAILARSMDLIGFTWEYEPSRFSDGRWVPDFFVCVTLVIKGVPGWRCLPFIFEFKPSPVTEACKLELCDRLTNVTGKSGHIIGALIVGSPFDPGVPRSASMISGKCKWRKANALMGIFDKFDEAKRYRFDLQNGVPPSKERDGRVGF